MENLLKKRDELFCDENLSLKIIVQSICADFPLFFENFSFHVVFT